MCIRDSAIGEALSPREGVAHELVGLEALEFLERRQIRVCVIEMQHEADRHQIVIEVIEKRAPAGPPVERPAERVLHQPLAMLPGRNLPEFLEAKPEFLRLAAVAEAELCLLYTSEPFGRA